MKLPLTQLLTLFFLAVVCGCGISHIPAGHSNAPSPPPLSRWLGNDVALARAAGANEASVIVAEAGAVGDRFTRVVETSPHECLLVMARASEKVADADLYAYAEDGTALAFDDRSDAKPTLLLCPPHPRHVYVTARIAAGQGFMAVAIQLVPPDRARRIQATLRAIEPHNSEAETPPPTISDVDQRLSEHLRALGGQWSPIAQTAVAVDSRIPSVTGILVDAGTCIDALVLAPVAVSGLDVEALDESGRTLGRAASTEQDRWMTVCTDDKRSFTLQLRPHEGNGTVLVLVSRASLRVGRALENEVELGHSLSIEQVSERLHAQLRARHQQIGAPIARLTISRGEQQRLEQRAEPGCSRYDVMAGSPNMDVQSRAYAATGELVSSSQGGQHMPLLVCEAGAATLVFDAISRGGPLLIEKSRMEKPSRSVMACPRAASRLLIKAWDLGLVLNSEDLNAAQKVSVAAKKPWDHEVVTRIGQCTDVFASLDDNEAFGIGLSRIDSDSDQASDSEQHPHSAHLQLCCVSRLADCHQRVRVFTESAGANVLVTTSTRS